MLCTVCRNGLEGTWDPSKTQRLGLRSSMKSTEHGIFRYLREIQDADEATLLEAEQDLQEVEKYIYGHHPSEKSSNQSREEGCIACGMVYESAEIVEQFGYSTAFTIDYMDDEDGTEFEMRIYHSNGEKKEVAFAPYPRRMQFLHSILTDSTEDIATWNLAERWLSTCVATHEACAITSKSKRIPTRLLKLDAEKDTFHLVCENEVEPGSRYAALSHCWGSKSWAPHLILNSHNDVSLRREQPVAILPKTFRDAFIIIRRLNLQYLWIDRFCIYQDSKEDWQKEASTMYSVYRNSFICISALSAHDDDGGCFFTRDIEQVKPSTVKFSKDGESEPMLYSSYRSDNVSWQRNFNLEVLTGRAWVVQERLLAPRTLHFGENQIYWECNQDFRSETHPEHEWRRAEATLLANIEDVSGLRTIWKTLIGGTTPYQTVPLKALTDEWFGILEFYSRCKLSQGEDKLVAISAIAKDMKRRLEGLGEPTAYFAGMWGLWLPGSLLWSVYRTAAQKHRPRQYRAPSWSWASVDSHMHCEATGILYGESRQGQVIASVASVQVTHLTDDDAGQVVSGAVTLRGKLVRVLLRKLRARLDTEYSDDVWRLRGFENIQGDSHEDSFDEGLQRVRNPIVIFDTEEDGCESALFLPIHAWTDADSMIRYQGLILAKSGSEYRRVGYMEWDWCGALQEVEEYEVRIV